MTHVRDLFRLDGKVALVTGGNRGLGYYMAEGLAEAGASVVICGRDLERIERAADTLRQSGHPCLAIRCDVSVEADVIAMGERVGNELGRCDVLVNNAAISAVGLAHEMTLDAWRRTMAVNLDGAFLCTRELGKLMLAQQSGSVINLSSEHGTLGFPGVAAFATAKLGIVGFTRALAVEWGPSNIRVNTILPGSMQEGMLEMLQDPNSEFYKVAGESLLRLIPLRKFGTIDDIKAAVVYLASDAGRYVTGAQLVIDGGFTINSGLY